MNPLWTKILILAVVASAAAIALLARGLAGLRRERKALLQQKDVVFHFVHDVGEVFAETDTVDLPGLLRRVLSYALRTTKAGAGALYVAGEDGDTMRVGAMAGIFPPIVGGLGEGIGNAFSKVGYVEKLVREQPARVGEGLVGDVMARGMPILIEDAEMDNRVPVFTEDFLRVHSMLLAPLRFRREVLGVMVVVNRIDGNPFTQSDLGLLQALIDQAAVSIHYARVSVLLDEKRRMDHDLDVARQIQTSLLPKKLPQFSGVEISAFSIPALEIGGDFFDVIRIDEDHVGMAVADVSGKGIAGAIMMSVCRGVLRTEARSSLSPAEVLCSVNRTLSEDVTEDMFVSMLYMVLNVRTLQLRVARAGHTEPIVHPGYVGGARTIESRGMAVGLAEPEMFDQAMEERTLTLQPGDTIVAYTDGVTEANDEAGREWGLLNLVQTIEIAVVQNETAAQVVSEVRTQLTQFAGDRPPYDDMTLVVIQIKKDIERLDEGQTQT